MAKIKTYYVWVNCTSFQKFAVEATSKAEAERKAAQHFQCDSRGGEAASEETRLIQPDDFYDDLIESYEYTERLSK